MNPNTMPLVPLKADTGFISSAPFTISSTEILNLHTQEIQSILISDLFILNCRNKFLQQQSHNYHQEIKNRIDSSLSLIVKKVSFVTFIPFFFKVVI